MKCPETIKGFVEVNDYSGAVTLYLKGRYSDEIDAIDFVERNDDLTPYKMATIIQFDDYFAIYEVKL